MAIADLLRGNVRDVAEPSGDDEDLIIDVVPDDVSSLGSVSETLLSLSADAEDDDPDQASERPKRDRSAAHRAQASGRRPKVPSFSEKASGAQRKQVGDSLEFMLTLLTGTLAMKDPHCGGAAFAQREEITKALIPLVCKNPTLLRWFTATDAPFMDFMALFLALKPVGQAVWQHHVAKAPVNPQGVNQPRDLSGYAAPAF